MSIVCLLGQVCTFKEKPETPVSLEEKILNLNKYSLGDVTRVTFLPKSCLKRE